MDTYQESPGFPSPPQVRIIPGPVSGFMPMDPNLYGWQEALNLQMFLVEKHQDPRAMATVGSLPPGRMSYLYGIHPKALCLNLSLPGRQGIPLQKGVSCHYQEDDVGNRGSAGGRDEERKWHQVFLWELRLHRGNSLWHFLRLWDTKGLQWLPLWLGSGVVL